MACECTFVPMRISIQTTTTLTRSVPMATHKASKDGSGEPRMICALSLSLQVFPVSLIVYVRASRKVTIIFFLSENVLLGSCKGDNEVSEVAKEEANQQSPHSELGSLEAFGHAQ